MGLSTTTYYLVRHGKRQKQPGDPPLTEVGRSEAEATARWLASKPIVAVYSSPLRRCTETAAPIAARHNLQVVIDKRLRERANWGDLPGQSFEAFVAMWEASSRHRDEVPAVGDSARAAGERFESALRDIHQQHPHAYIAIATHGGVIIDFLLNHYTPQELAVRNPDYAHMAECSITTVTFDGTQFVLEVLAADAHLSSDRVKG